MLDLHDNLLNGPTGRRVNGIGALALLMLCASGLIIWWPGAARWRRSVLVDTPRQLEASELEPAQRARVLVFRVHPDVEPDRRLPRAAGPGLRLARLHRAARRSQSGRTGRRSDSVLAGVSALRPPGRPRDPGMRPRPVRFDHEGHVGRRRCRAGADGGDRRGDVVESRRRAGVAAMAYSSRSSFVAVFAQTPADSTATTIR